MQADLNNGPHFFAIPDKRETVILCSCIRITGIRNVKYYYMLTLAAGSASAGLEPHF